MASPTPRRPGRGCMRASAPEGWLLAASFLITMAALCPWPSSWWRLRPMSRDGWLSVQRPAVQFRCPYISRWPGSSVCCRISRLRWRKLLSSRCWRFYYCSFPWLSSPITSTAGSCTSTVYTNAYIKITQQTSQYGPSKLAALRTRLLPV